MDLPVIDKIGQPITVGCYIAYGHALGRCAGLRIGKVLKVTGKTLIGYNTREEYKYRITVLGIDDDRDYQPVKLCDRKGTLLFPDRIIVLAEDFVPQHMKDLFNDCAR